MIWTGMTSLNANVVSKVCIVITEKNKQLVVFSRMYTYNTKVLLLTLFPVVLRSHRFPLLTFFNTNFAIAYTDSQYRCWLYFSFTSNINCITWPSTVLINSNYNM